MQTYSNDGRIEDWGYIVAVTAYGYGYHDASRRALTIAERAGYLPVRVMRGQLQGENPDPESYPSGFEILVQIKEG